MAKTVEDTITRSERQRRGLQKQTLVGVVLAGPALLLVAVLFLIPLTRLVVESVTEPQLGIHNYVDAFTDPVSWRIIKTTLVLSVECSVLALIIGYPIAFAMATLPRGAARVLMILVLLPFWTSVLVRMYAWMILLGNRGIVNSTLQASGVSEEPHQLLYTRFAVVLGMTHYLVPFMILALYSTMHGINRDLLKCSNSLGASNWQTFRRVYFPLSLPGVFAGTLLVFILALGFYVTPALLGGPRDTTMPVYIQQQVEQLEFGQATAMGIILLVLVLALFFLYDRFLGFDNLLRGLGGR